MLGQAIEIEDQSVDVEFQNMAFLVRVIVGGVVGRIQVLAASVRTARGFSGDVIFDEFAFHQDSVAIWEAAEPIVSSNPDFLCRIASTGNGKHNMFYRMATGGQFKVSRVPRTLANQQGVKVYDPNTRLPITPEEARRKALDKRAYDQNYECMFTDENSVLLTHELIAAAEMAGVGFVCDQDWSPQALALMRAAIGPLDLGCDVGRHRDLTMMVVGESLGSMRFVRGILRIQNMRLPDQQRRLGEVCRMPKFRRGNIDMTGIGLGLTEYSQEEFGSYKIHGINFSSTVPTTAKIKEEGRKQETVRVTEAMAVGLLQAHEDRTIKYPADGELRDDLRKPEKIVSPGGRVSIAATRNEAGHADGFWGMALYVEAASSSGGPFVRERVEAKGMPDRIMRTRGVLL